jgi:hypothetical protein
MSDQEEYILVWEAPKIETPEFRLYYDDKGQVITYTCEKLEGNFIIVNAQTFAEARPDAKVLNGRLIKANSGSVVSKLVPSKKEGTTCAAEDASIIIKKNTQKIKTQKWKLETYEL